MEAAALFTELTALIPAARELTELETPPDSTHKQRTWLHQDMPTPEALLILEVECPTFFVKLWAFAIAKHIVADMPAAQVGLQEPMTWFSIHRQDLRLTP